jgi:hypothetical protein
MLLEVVVDGTLFGRHSAFLLLLLSIQSNIFGNSSDGRAFTNFVLRDWKGKGEEGLVDLDRVSE